MKADKDLLQSLASYLKSRPRSTKAIHLAMPTPGFDTTEEIGQAIAAAEAKWFVENVTRGIGPRGQSWTFDLTTRGTEAFDLD
jgi:hypothetical protein